MGSVTKKKRSRMFGDCLTAEIDHQWGASWPGPRTFSDVNVNINASADIKRSSLRALWRDRTKQ